MDYLNTISEVGAVTAQNHRLPSPELLGFLCARGAGKSRPKPNLEAVRVVAETLHRIFPGRVHLTRNMFTVH